MKNAVLFTIAFMTMGMVVKKSDYRLILPVEDYPLSYDPIDADLSNNIDLMKLRYLTPIEIGQDDKFRSSVLKDFQYDNKEFKMTWKVKTDLKYADGTPITPADIVLSLKRMAQKRSEFPVLSSVKGLKAWSSKKDALSQDIPGIELEGDTITISFERNVPNPLFQFSLALFAIQPARCFDLKTTKLVCEVPPASGYYDYADGLPKLDPKEGQTPPIAVAIRKGFESAGNFRMPERITLEYSGKSLSDLVKTMDENSVVRTLDSRLTDEFINQFRSEVEIKRLPKTAIWYLLLNPKFDAFKNRSCRRIFANRYRDLYGERIKSVRVASRSFSSPIMPGYLTNEQLDKLVPTEESAACKEAFQKYPIRYKKTYPFWDKLLTDTMVSLGMPTTGVYKADDNISDFWDAFVANQTAVIAEAVSFWPLDLASGFNMFFSPNMHPQLSHLLRDRKLAEVSDQLFREGNPAAASAYYEKINIMLYEEAQLNALSYYGDVYVSKGRNVNRLPIATSEPNPWHFFSVK